MNDIEGYLVREHVEDFRDGLITRRELLRRVTLITGSAAAALAEIAACAPAPSPSPTAARTAAPASPTPVAVSPTAAAAAYATPPPAGTTDGITVKPDDPRITAAKADVKAADGATLIGYLARPRSDGKYPGIVVIHENRGLLEHIRDVTRRVATAGFVAVSVDLLSRAGGADKLTDGAAYGAELSKRSVDDMVKDLAAALDHLRARSVVEGTKLGATGFCFGGGMVWSLVNSGASLRAAVPFYGPTPSNNAGIASTRAAVLGVYAGNDTFVNPGMATIEEQLKKAGVPYKLNTYPGVGHAFYNDTGQRYDAEQARRAWVDTIEWFKKYLA